MCTNAFYLFSNFEVYNTQFYNNRYVFIIICLWGGGGGFNLIYRNCTVVNFLLNTIVNFYKFFVISKLYNLIIFLLPSNLRTCAKLQFDTISGGGSELHYVSSAEHIVIM